MQAANTGLTGGSTPDGANYDREIVLVNTLRITGVQVIAGGDQAVCLPGATLDKLESRRWRRWGASPFGHRLVALARRCWAASATTRAARWCAAAPFTPSWRCTPA